MFALRRYACAHKAYNVHVHIEARIYWAHSKYCCPCKGNKFQIHADRMLSCCCSNLTCPWKQVIRTDEFRQETVDGRQLYTEDGTQTLESTTRMDIALLEKQYTWNKEKQKKETRVVVFKTGKYLEVCVKKMVSCLWVEILMFVCCDQHVLDLAYLLEATVWTRLHNYKCFRI